MYTRTFQAGGVARAIHGWHGAQPGMSSRLRAFARRFLVTYDGNLGGSRGRRVAEPWEGGGVYRPCGHACPAARWEGGWRRTWAWCRRQRTKDNHGPGSMVDPGSTLGRSGVDIGSILGLSGFDLGSISGQYLLSVDAGSVRGDTHRDRSRGRLETARRSATTNLWSIGASSRWQCTMAPSTRCRGWRRDWSRKKANDLCLYTSSPPGSASTG